MIDWRNINSIFLDMDGTLLDLDFDNHFWLELVPARYAEHHGISPDAAEARLLPRFKATEGRLEWYCLDYWSGLLDLDLVRMKAEIAERIAVLPHAADFLDALRRQGKRLVLVTNAHPKGLNLKLERTGLHAFFDRIVSSHDLGRPKEDPVFWELLQAIEPFEPRHTLLVDDSLPVLRSARIFGIAHAVAIRRNDSSRPPREITEFPSIEDFRELMP